MFFFVKYYSELIDLLCADQDQELSITTDTTKFNSNTDMCVTSINNNFNDHFISNGAQANSNLDSLCNSTCRDQELDNNLDKLNHASTQVNLSGVTIKQRSNFNYDNLNSNGNFSAHCKLCYNTEKFFHCFENDFNYKSYKKHCIDNNVINNFVLSCVSFYLADVLGDLGLCYTDLCEKCVSSVMTLMCVQCKGSGSADGSYDEDCWKCYYNFNKFSKFCIDNVSSLKKSSNVDNMSHDRERYGMVVENVYRGLGSDRGHYGMVDLVLNKSLNSDSTNDQFVCVSPPPPGLVAFWDESVYNVNGNSFDGQSTGLSINSIINYTPAVFSSGDSITPSCYQPFVHNEYINTGFSNFKSWGGGNLQIFIILLVLLLHLHSLVLKMFLLHKFSLIFIFILHFSLNTQVFQIFWQNWHR
jgi:hypothetical protein